MKQIALVVVGALILVVGFQNCGSNFEAIESEGVELASSLRLGEASASWSDSLVWYRDPFSDSHAQLGKEQHPSCPPGTQSGTTCSSNSGYCQYGSGSSVEVYRCGNVGYDVSGHVIDYHTKAPIAGALIEFNTGGPVNIFGNYSLKTDADGKFSTSLPAQPRLIYASAAGYEDARNPGLAKARVTIVNNSIAPLILKRVEKASAPIAANDASCSFNGNIVLHSHSIKAYKSASGDTGGSCVAETRVCFNGTLSGSYSHGTCVVKSQLPAVAITTPAPAASNTGWGANRQWTLSEFGATYVNANKETHPACAASTTSGSACTTEGAYCQVGQSPNAKVYHCSSSFKVNVAVFDVETKKPISGVSLEFHSGHPAFPVGGPAAGTTNSTGLFSALYTHKPGIVKGYKTGYTNPTFASQKHVSSAVNESGSTTIYLKKVASVSDTKCSYLYKAPVVEVHSQFAALHCGAPHWDGKIKCEYTSGRYTKGEGWGTCQCYKYVSSTLDSNGSCKAVSYTPPAL